MRSNSEGDLTTRQRLIIAHGTSISAETALSMPAEEFTFEFLVENSVKAANLAAASIGPATLRRHGCTTASNLVNLGFDSLYLTDSKFATEASHAFGSAEVSAAFLKSASDAVALAGSDGMQILSVDVSALLERCVGAPAEAAAVLQQLPAGRCLTDVKASVLLDSGLRKGALGQLGYSLSVLVEQTGASAAELRKLGF